MKVAYVTLFDPHDINRGSGTFYSLIREVARQGHQVHYLGPLPLQHLPLPNQLIRGVARRLGRKCKNYLDPFICAQRGRLVTEKLQALDYDLVLTTEYGIAAYVKTDRPIVVYTDVMLPLGYPEGVHDLSRAANLFMPAVKMYQHTIRKGLERMKLCVLPAQWAVDFALEYAEKYGIDASKIVRIPFGANVNDPGQEVVEARIAKGGLSKQPVEVLFVGKEWERKGGDIAVEAVEALLAQGVNSVLHVVGAEPAHHRDKPHVKLHGFLDKSVPEDHALLDSLFRNSHVFILPSSSEGFVISALEAAAYALPAVGYKADGVDTAIRDGESGVLLELGTQGEAFAEVIQRWMEDTAEYEKLIKGARTHYLRGANWTNTVTRLFEEIEKRGSLTNRVVTVV